MFELNHSSECADFCKSHRKRTFPYVWYNIPDWKTNYGLCHFTLEHHTNLRGYYDWLH